MNRNVVLTHHVGYEQISHIYKLNILNVEFCGR